MGAFSLWHWLIILAVVLLLFGGGGKIPKLMRDMGSGITAFRKGLKDDDKKDSDEGEQETKALEEKSGGEAPESPDTASGHAQSGAESSDRKAANG